MEPTVPVAGRFLLDKASFRVTGIERGDIVEFALPEEPGRHGVKRVIGLPGDTVACRDGVVELDGTPLDEPYLDGGAQHVRLRRAGRGAARRAVRARRPPRGLPGLPPLGPDPAVRRGGPPADDLQPAPLIRRVVGCGS
nr:hypothetical protein GCM10020092_069360 [Actinoplanes digitatis]